MSPASLAISSAMFRVAMWPEAQAGAPGQAAIFVRGSAGSVTKPSEAAALRSSAQAVRRGRGRAECGCGAKRISEAPSDGGALCERDEFFGRHAAEGQGDGEGVWPSVRAKMPMGGRRHRKRPRAPLCPAGHLPHKGGDCAVIAVFANLEPSAGLAQNVAETRRNLPPCGGDVRQDRGGRDGVPTARDVEIACARQFRSRSLRAPSRPSAAIASGSRARYHAAASSATDASGLRRPAVAGNGQAANAIAASIAVPPPA